jgi:hypothetical protein
MQSGLALGDDAYASSFMERFGDDPHCRQVAAYRATGNVTSDRVGDRAVAWLMVLFDDENKDVRDEAAKAHWNENFGRQDRPYIPRVLSHRLAILRRAP